MRKIRWPLWMAGFGLLLPTGVAMAQYPARSGSSGNAFSAVGDSAAEMWHKIVPVGNTTPTANANPQDATSLANRGKASPELFIQMAMFSEQSGRPEQAEENYQKALRLSPKHVGTLLSYAGFKDRQRSPREALDLYQKAAKYHPKEAAVYNDLGLFYARQRKYPEAIAQYEKAIQLQPSRPRYRNNIAIVLVETGQHDKALAHLAATSREPDAYYNMGYLVSTKGEMAASRQYFAKAVELDPTRTDAQTWLEHIDGALAASPAVKPDGGAAAAASAPRTARRTNPSGDAPASDSVAAPRGAMRPGLPPAPEMPPAERNPMLDRRPTATRPPASASSGEPAPMPPTQRAPSADRGPTNERKPTPAGVRRLPPPSSEQGVEVPAAPARLPSSRTSPDGRPGPIDTASKPGAESKSSAETRFRAAPKSGGPRNVEPNDAREPAPLPPDASVPSDTPRTKPARLPPIGDVLEPPLPPTTRSGRRIAGF